MKKQFENMMVALQSREIKALEVTINEGLTYRVIPQRDDRFQKVAVYEIFVTGRACGIWLKDYCKDSEMNNYSTVVEKISRWTDNFQSVTEIKAA